jgi:hypothetical protein
MFNGELKFIKLTKHESKFKVLVNLNDIIFVNDEGPYREVNVKLHDRIINLQVDDEIDTIHGMIEMFKFKQPIYD